LVSIATHPVNATQLPATRPELMCHAVESADRLAPLLERATTVAVGPGMGDSAWAQDLFQAVLQADRSLVVDADALNLLAGTRTDRGDWILTPHPGEAARLLDTSTRQIQADRPAALAALADRFGGTIVLKGAGTLVSSATGVPWLCTAGNPGMASAGMGDALTGIIAGLRAQSLSAGLAARVGVEVHARAGDAAASDGERGLIASDVIGNIRAFVNP
jgi:NAD(P)H-hydrate epimerase